ncbi:MAG: ATP-binding protein [Deltaproteobacteria bacterium]|nr:ATP-binding protein [Deltaproteobacteria bacterium]MBW1929704.1 ATP-binding protein [Deltaproteobacteria bacterium]MBW2023994.1 ATP-binding protein [Deltaproteobacteria bacterium]MBW2125012.1 ATP-binding protein [Deltaproteobacteria bacterium]
MGQKGQKQDYVPITVDKSHIVTIGERLYEQSIELIRELVNNAYDADATRVDVTVAPSEITVTDNGEGMDLEGLRQYFNVGSDAKLQNPVSPRFTRQRIGQFGIGKFASLAAASRFELITQKGHFAAKVVFDKEKWMKQKKSWRIPLTRLQPNPKKGNGTTVKLINLHKSFKPEDVIEKIIEGVPIRAKDFAVYVNGYRVMPRVYKGNRIPVMEGTEFGIVYGEIVILPAYKASKDDLGIEIKVKGVTVKRELFDMASWGKAATRIRGEINVDFLPLTSDRSGFIEDSPEYKTFLKVMKKTMADVKKAYEQLASTRENQRVSRALKEALERIHRALVRNPEFSPFGVVPIAEPGKEGEGETGVENSGGKEEPQEPQIQDIETTDKEMQNQFEESSEPEAIETKKGKKPSLRIATPNAVVRRLKFGDMGVTCCLDHLGEDGPECMTEGTIIYINRDHPLYKRESKKREAHILNIARLITQEISLMKNPDNPREAFNRQSKLLKDAFRDDEELESKGRKKR